MSTYQTVVFFSHCAICQWQSNWKATQEAADKAELNHIKRKHSSNKLVEETLIQLREKLLAHYPP